MQKMGNTKFVEKMNSNSYGPIWPFFGKNRWTAVFWEKKKKKCKYVFDSYYANILIQSQIRTNDHYIFSTFELIEEFYEFYLKVHIFTMSTDLRGKYCNFLLRHYHTSIYWVMEMLETVNDGQPCIQNKQVFIHPSWIICRF